MGTAEHRNGQTTFYVSRSALRHVGDVFTKMLTGEWAERDRSEVHLPDDSCKTMEILLRIAHWQFVALSAKVTVWELRDLAVLADKYNAAEAVSVAVQNKRWMPNHTCLMNQPVCQKLQDIAMIYMVFGDEAGLNYVVHRLAFEIERVTAESGYSYHCGEDYGMVELRSDLPDRLLSMDGRAVGEDFANALPARIHDPRNVILHEWIPIFQDAHPATL